jgi:hypothetical protein
MVVATMIVPVAVAVVAVPVVVVAAGARQGRPAPGLLFVLFFAAAAVPRIIGVAVVVLGRPPALKPRRPGRRQGRPAPLCVCL